MISSILGSRGPASRAGSRLALGWALAGPLIGWAWGSGEHHDQAVRAGRPAGRQTAPGQPQPLKGEKREKNTTKRQDDRGEKGLGYLLPCRPPHRTSCLGCLQFQQSYSTHSYLDRDVRTRKAYLHTVRRSKRGAYAFIAQTHVAQWHALLRRLLALAAECDTARCVGKSAAGHARPLARPRRATLIFCVCKQASRPSTRVSRIRVKTRQNSRRGRARRGGARRHPWPAASAKTSIPRCDKA